MKSASISRYLATEGQVAASTQNQALAALLFLDRDVLEIELPFIDGIERAKRRVRIPVVLTREEANHLISQLSGLYQLMAAYHVHQSSPIIVLMADSPADLI